MPSRTRSFPMLDDDGVEELPGNPDREVVAEALALAEEAEAEAAEAEALAAAARARARALRLRRQAGAAQPGTPKDADATETPETITDENDAELDDTEGDATEVDAIESADSVRKAARAAKPAWSRLRRLRHPQWKAPRLKAVAVGVAIVCACALVAASGYMAWDHRQALRHEQRAAEFAAAARQGAVVLFSIDHNKAEEDVQRILDNSTGQFRDDFQRQAADFTKVAQESKVVTEGSVQATAVESMTDDSAVVLVAATSTVTNAAGAKQDPRPWRLSINVARDGEQIKMSKVEFIP